MNNLLKDLATLPSYDMECRGYNGDEMIKQKPWADVDYITNHGELAGDWLRSEDVIELLKKHNLL